ncbi:MAG: hypothetical protein ACHQET_01020 [Chitinophagales bacterium]
MRRLREWPKLTEPELIIASAILLILAFIQCYLCTHDLFWAYGPDYDRDIGLIQSSLEGHYGKDPNFAGEYIWYNPLIYSIETIVVKITDLPISVVVTRIGTYLNLLSPIALYIMTYVLFDVRIATASLLSFLFFATGNMPAWGAATYSPWIGADSFMQFLFYLNIIFTYKAFSLQKNFWFFILGSSLGICFLGHTAPTVLSILILATLQSANIFNAWRDKRYEAIKKCLLQSIIAFTPFVLVASPFLYIIILKYHLQFRNHFILEFSNGIFHVSNWRQIIKENLSISFIVSIIGFVWFWKNIKNVLIRKIIFAWLFWSVFMYVYTTCIPKVYHVLNIQLPDTVSAFHYFFYLKALQSVFFGFGFVFLFQTAYLLIDRQILKKLRNSLPRVTANSMFFIVVLTSAILYYPKYKERKDFVELREQAISKQNEKDKIEVYRFIVQNIPSGMVILCEHDLSTFPVMATGRKMVSIESTFTNPYLDYEERESAREQMLLFLRDGKPTALKKLFEDYQVSFILLSNEELNTYNALSTEISQVVFKNESYTLFALSM